MYHVIQIWEINKNSDGRPGQKIKISYESSNQKFPILLEYEKYTNTITPTKDEENANCIT
jgi:hypothetical protein